MAKQFLHRFRIVCLFALGMFLMLLAFLLPAGLRSVDSRLVQFAGRDSSSIVDEIDNQIGLARPGIARLLLEGARRCGIPDLDRSRTALEALEAAHPELVALGGSFPELAALPLEADAPFTTVIESLVPTGNRRAIIRDLETSRRPGVQVLLETGELVHTEILAPVSESGGVTLETLLVTASLLSQGDRLQSTFRIELERLASDANRGMSPRDLETTFLNLLSFAHRMNWAQFSGFLSRFENRDSLHAFADALSAEEDSLPILFTAVWLSPSATLAGEYLERWPETGRRDITLALSHQREGLGLLLERGHRLFEPPAPIRHLHTIVPDIVENSLSRLALSFPILAMLAKYLAIGLAAFLCIRAGSLLLPPPGPALRYFEVESLTTPRHLILTLFVVLSVIVMCEPFLAQSRQTSEIPPRWSFPTAPAAVVDAVDSIIGESSEEITLLALVVFFLIQVGVYVMCRIKLREIERQKGSSRLKIKLLDNEDNMFDSGLYVGLGGTVLSLVLLTFQLVDVSLTAAYSSTLFGIIFTSLLKIFHVRPYRRKLLIESESGIL